MTLGPKQREVAERAIREKVKADYPYMSDDAIAPMVGARVEKLNTLAKEFAESRREMTRAADDTRYQLERHSLEGVRQTSNPNLAKAVLVTDADGKYHRVDFARVVDRIAEFQRSNALGEV